MLNSIKQDINQIGHSKLKDQVPVSWAESNNSQPTLGILVSGVHSEFLYLKEYADRFSKDLQVII
jgi:tRNA A37 threonylcarbamoyltransferase TsaD